MAFQPSQMRFVMPAADTSKAFVEGKFSKTGQAALRAENLRIAEVTQSYVVRYIEKSYKRPNVSSGRLARVTANSKNISATAFRIGVGKTSYLDQSQAKYWRTIEDGSAATWRKRSFLELDLRGTFGATLVGRRAGPGYSTPGGAVSPVAGDSHGARSEAGPEHGTGKFLPTGKYWKSPVTGKTYRMPVFHPGHEIAPMGAYASAMRQSRFTDETVKAARKYLRDVLKRVANGEG